MGLLGVGPLATIAFATWTIAGLEISAAEAQACCAATGSGQFGVVGYRRQAVIAERIAYDHAFGSYDADGRYHSLRNAGVNDLIVTLAGGIRLWPEGPLQIYGALPFRLQHRDLDGLSDPLRAGFGDSSVGSRWTLVEDRQLSVDAAEPETWLPYLDVSVDARLPTGVAEADRQTTTGADVTGDGAWGLGVGVRLTKFMTAADAVVLAGGHMVRSSRATLEGPEHHPGNEWTFELGYLHVIDFFWDWGFGLNLRHTALAKFDEIEIENSDSLRLRLSGHATWNFAAPGWELTAGASIDPFLDDLGKNVPFAGGSISLAIGYAFPR